MTHTCFVVVVVVVVVFLMYEPSERDVLLNPATPLFPPI